MIYQKTVVASVANNNNTNTFYVLEKILERESNDPFKDLDLLERFERLKKDQKLSFPILNKGQFNDR